jgi:hypothetical protein
VAQGRRAALASLTTAKAEQGLMTSTSKSARIAGFLYLLLVIVGPLRLMYIPSKLFVHGNASATANNIAAHEPLFRLGIVGDLFCGTILIFIVLALYRLFKGVDQKVNRSFALSFAALCGKLS